MENGRTLLGRLFESGAAQARKRSTQSKPDQGSTLGADLPLCLEALPLHLWLFVSLLTPARNPFLTPSCDNIHCSQSVVYVARESEVCRL